MIGTPAEILAVLRALRGTVRTRQSHFVLLQVRLAFHLRDCRPVDRVHKAHFLVLLNPDIPSTNRDEVGESDLSQFQHFVDNQRVIFEQIPSSDDGEVGEELIESCESSDSVEHEVAGDLDKIWERNVGNVFFFDVVEEKNGDRAFDNATVVEEVEFIEVVADNYAATD